MVAGKKFLGILLVPFAVFQIGCESCSSHPKESSVVPIAPVSSKSIYEIDVDAIFRQIKAFSYRSELVISLAKATAMEQSSESVELLARQPRIYLKKQLDNSHFYELFKDGDRYLLKNQGGFWRKGADNQPMYTDLVKDGVNVIAWLVDEFAMADQLSRRMTDNGREKLIYIKDAPIDGNAPFMKKLVQKIANFETVESSTITVSISMDQKTNLPLNAAIDVNIVGPLQQSIHIKARMMLDLKGAFADLTPPKIEEDAPATFPVNIGPRFSDLMDKSSRKGKQ